MSEKKLCIECNLCDMVENYPGDLVGMKYVCKSDESKQSVFDGKQFNLHWQSCERMRNPIKPCGPFGKLWVKIDQPVLVR